MLGHGEWFTAVGKANSSLAVATVAAHIKNGQYRGCRANTLLAEYHACLVTRQLHTASLACNPAHPTTKHFLPSCTNCEGLACHRPVPSLLLDWHVGQWPGGRPPPATLHTPWWVFYTVSIFLYSLYSVCVSGLTHLSHTFLVTHCVQCGTHGSLKLRYYGCWDCCETPRFCHPMRVIRCSKKHGFCRDMWWTLPSFFVNNSFLVSNFPITYVTLRTHWGCKKC